jgi:IS5 family transposase
MIVHAPSSTKNKKGKRDPEMSQTKKGNHWNFGMKAHIGVDGSSGLVYTLVGTTAKTADITQLDNLLHGDEQVVLGDAGYHKPDFSTLVRSGYWESPKEESDTGFARAELGAIHRDAVSQHESAITNG